MEGIGQEFPRLRSSERGAPSQGLGFADSPDWVLPGSVQRVASSSDRSAESDPRHASAT
jgi:hypothetical protein